MPQDRSVKIRNPIDGAGWTSAKRALKYLKRGQARLVGESEIEFIASDFRAQSAERSMTTTPDEPVARVTPSHGPALTVVSGAESAESLRTFCPYPFQWKGYLKAA